MGKIIADYIEELKKQDNILGILIFGSYARGEQRENSDVDVFALVKDGTWRDVEVRDGQVFEMVYSSPNNARQFYETNPNDAVQQWTDGEVVYDPDGEMEKMREFVLAIKEKGKKAIDEKQMRHLQFDAEDKVRAIEAVQINDLATASLQLSRLGNEMLEIYFDLHQLWTPAPKQQLKYLRANDKEMSQSFDDFFREQDFNARLEDIRKIIGKLFSTSNQ